MNETNPSTQARTLIIAILKAITSSAARSNQVEELYRPGV
jgi:hypothetical protein